MPGRTNAPTTKRTGKKGRPSSLTPETLSAIVKAIRNLGTYEDAAIAGGVHPSTFQRWMATGAKDFEEHRDTDYRHFYDTVETANGQVKAILTGRLFAASRTDGRLALKILERRWARDWGLKIDVTDSTPKPKSSPRDVVLKRLAQIETRQKAALAVLSQSIGEQGE